MADAPSEGVDGASDEDDSGAVCRICFDGPSGGTLTTPCLCRGTQAYVHDSCLLRWRRLQILQGKTAAATRCEVCGSRYAAHLAQPGRPLAATLAELARVVVETLGGLAWFACSSGSCSLGPVVLGLLLWLRFGALHLLLALLVAVPSITVLLYTQGLRLSVVGTGQDRRLRLTSFGLPVEGLCPGMLLVSISAGGPFRRSVLYVTDHTDRGSLAFILNHVSGDDVVSLVGLDKDAGSSMTTEKITLRVSSRTGGPVNVEGAYVLHNVGGFPGAETLVRSEPVFCSRFPSKAHGELALGRALRAGAGAGGTGFGQQRFAIAFQGVSSWGEHQLEGEIRRGAWGWVKPEHFVLSHLLSMSSAEMGQLWESLIRSPNLEVFHGG